MCAAFQKDLSALMVSGKASGSAGLGSLEMRAGLQPWGGCGSEVVGFFTHRDHVVPSKCFEKAALCQVGQGTC